MARFPAMRKGNALVPTTQDGRDAVNRLPHDGDLMVSVTQPRNVRQFNLFWALVDIVRENSEVYSTKERAKRGLLFATNYVEVWFDHHGRMHIDPKSIAWENMPPDKFDEFFQAAVPVICDWLGTSPAEVRERAYEMVDGPRKTRQRRPRQDSPPLAPEQSSETERVDAETVR